MTPEKLKQLLPLRIDATGEYLLIEPEILGELITELLEIGDERPVSLLVDKLDKYATREELYQEWYSLGLKLQQRDIKS